MAIENTVSSNFLSAFVDCKELFDCRQPGVIPITLAVKIKSLLEYLLKSGSKPLIGSAGPGANLII